MWKEVLDNSALILGLAISVYTIYSAIDNYLVRRRQKAAFIRSLDIRMKYLLKLGDSLASLAKQTFKKYPVKIRSGSQRGGLPEESKDDVEDLLIRTYHVLGFGLDWDEEKIGAALTDEQIDRFLDFLKAYQTYHEVLTVRANQLKRAPDNAAELSRLSMVTDLNLAPMQTCYNAFNELIKMRTQQRPQV